MTLVARSRRSSSFLASGGSSRSIVPTNSCPDPLGQEAMHAPQLMQPPLARAFMATGNLASFATRRRAFLSTERSRLTGRDAARSGSIRTRSPSRYAPRCCMQLAALRSGPCGTPSTVTPHLPHTPSRHPSSKATGSSPAAASCSLSRSRSSSTVMSGWASGTS
jgi:hypothetical protein